MIFVVVVVAYSLLNNVSHNQSCNDTHHSPYRYINKLTFTLEFESSCLKGLALE